MVEIMLVRRFFIIVCSSSTQKISLMKDIIDTDLTTNQSSWDLRTLCQWLLIGILGCAIFENYNDLFNAIIYEGLFSLRSSGYYLNTFKSKIIGLVLILLLSYWIIQRFKSSYQAKKFNIGKTINLFIITYFIVLVLQFSFPFFKNYIEIPISLIGFETPELIAISESQFFMNSYYVIESLIKYGFVAYMLLKRS